MAEPPIEPGQNVLADARNLSIAVVGNYYDRQGATSHLGAGHSGDHAVDFSSDNLEQPGPVWDPFDESRRVPARGARSARTIHWFTTPEGHFPPPNRACERGRS